MYIQGVLIILFINTAIASSPHPMRAAKCVIPNGLEHVARAAFFQQCISKNYAQGNETQCYDDIGCFPMDSPWTTTLRPFPSPLHPAEIDLRPYCFTRDSTQRFNVSLWPDISLDSCQFKSDRKTVFITHGFASDGNFTWMSEMKDNYLKEVDANVFLVDWGRGAQLLNYLQVASNTRIVGAELARLITFLQTKNGLNPSHIHLIGHSLGAHISAYVAKAIPGVGRLTALDPAQPGFEGEHKKVRLDRDDATFVEVLHTNAAPFIPSLGFGMLEPHGHVDFYINGGLRQPGCMLPNISGINSIHDLAKIPVDVIGMWACCSHCRSFEYYKYVIQSNCTIWGHMTTFTGHLLNAGTLGLADILISKMNKCDADSCIPIGLETPDFKARGVFAAITHTLPPYCETDSEVNEKLLSEILGKSKDKSTKMTDGKKSSDKPGKEHGKRRSDEL